MFRSYVKESEIELRVAEQREEKLGWPDVVVVFVILAKLVCDEVQVFDFLLGECVDHTVAMLLVERERFVLLRVGVERRWVVLDNLQSLYFIAEWTVAGAAGL